MYQATLSLSSSLESYLSFLPPVSLKPPQCAKHCSGHCGYNYSYYSCTPTSWLSGHELEGMAQCCLIYLL